MRRNYILGWFVAFFMLDSLSLQAQQVDSGGAGSASTPGSTSPSGSAQPAAGSIPRLVKFSGLVKDVAGNPATGTVGLTFSLYELPEGGSPLWTENQNLSLDAQGHYAALLGAESPGGLPLDLFTSSKALWLGVQPQLPGAAEQPRVLLVAVPYALKSSDADTLGGLPASAFMLAPSANATGSVVVPNLPVTLPTPGPTPPPGSTTGAAGSGITGAGTTNYVAMFTGRSTIGSSSIYNSSTGWIGITNPTAPLDVNGSALFAGTLSAQSIELPAAGAATASQGFTSNPFDLIASSFNSATTVATPQLFRWRAEPQGNDTANPSATLNLQYLAGTGTPAETGLSIASNGQINFAAGQTFTGVGAGLTDLTAANISTGTAGINISGNAASAATASGLICAGCVGNAQLGVNFAGSASQGGSASNALLLNGLAASAFQPAGSYATLGANTFNAQQTISTGDVSISNGNLNLSATTGASGGVITLGGNPFAHAFGPANTFVGPNAGNFTMTRGDNTATGAGAFVSNATGSLNTASGVDALSSNTAGINNTADGNAALERNTTGLSNTAIGASGATFGVSGGNASTSDGAAGVLGEANGTSGVTSGVSGFINSSTNGAAGVNGIATSSTGTIYGVEGQNASNSGAGVFGNATSGTGLVAGVIGSTNSSTTNASGVQGSALASSGQTIGVWGITSSPNGAGVVGTGTQYGVTGTAGNDQPGAAAVYGNETATTSGNAVYGVEGTTSSSATNSAGVIGSASATSGTTYGVLGQTMSTTGPAAGVFGNASGGDGFVYGVYGTTNSPGGVGVFGSSQVTGVFGDATATSGFAVGVQGWTASPQGVAGWFWTPNDSGYVLLGASGSNYAAVFWVDASGNGYFSGNLNVSGQLTKGSGSFKIDDPLDPANKYLSHSFVESPEMMNVDNGVIRLDDKGEAWVTLPEYSEALNRDFRYQLTSVGAPGPDPYITEEVSHNRFKIAGGKPGGKVSWQVTGIRQDAYANAHRISQEEVKPASEQGYYLHPEVFGQPAERGIA